MEEKWILHNFNDEVEIPQIIFVNKTITIPSKKNKVEVIIRRLHEMIDPTIKVGSKIEKSHSIAAS